METNAHPQHTKGEWDSKAHLPLGTKKSDKGTSFESIITNPNIGIISVAYGRTEHEAKANAQRIAKAVNMHDELMEFIKSISKLGRVKGNITVSMIAKIVNESNDLIEQAEQK